MRTVIEIEVLVVEEIDRRAIKIILKGNINTIQFALTLIQKNTEFKDM